MIVSRRAVYSAARPAVQKGSEHVRGAEDVKQTVEPAHITVVLPTQEELGDQGLVGK